MSKRILLLVLILVGTSQAQWGSGGLFRFYISGTAAAKTDSIRLKGGGSTTVSLSGNQVTISSTVAAGTVDSTAVVDGGLINADIRVSTLDSSRIKPSGITQSDIRVSTLDSSRIAPSGITQLDIRVSTLDSSRIAPEGVTSSDIRTAAVGASQLAPTAVTAGTYTNGRFTIDADGRVTAANSLFQFAVDSASAMAGDTTWVWQNLTGASVTVDSIHVDASTDDYAISIVERNPNGGLNALVDAVTASTNGTNTFYITETTITAATIESFHWIGFKRPASTGDRVHVRIHYH